MTMPDQPAGRDLDDRLRTLTEQAAEADRLARQIATHRHGVEAAQQRVDRLEAQCRTEDEDVERLDGLSFSHLWSVVKGSHETDLARERDEASRARLALAHEQTRLAQERDLVARLQARRAELGDPAQLLARARDAKEQLLRASGTAAGQRLDDLARQHAAAKRRLREIDEAIAAGRAAAVAIDEALQLLSSADGWSSYDTFWGGGTFSSMIKHDKMDEAAQAVSRADRAIGALSAELQDVTGESVVLPALQLDGFTRFTDVWFDNIFTDLGVRDRIKDALAGVQRMDDAVGRVAHQLTGQRAEAAAALDRLAGERLSVLRSSRAS